jgi:hypothetical protein
MILLDQKLNIQPSAKGQQEPDAAVEAKNRENE